MFRFPFLLRRAFAAIFSLGLLCAVAAPAVAIPMSDLIAGATIDSDGLRFSNWVYTPSGDMPDAEFVNVVPIMDSDGFYGVRIQGAFFDYHGHGASDAAISYTVEVIRGKLITDAHLAGNPNVSPDKDLGEGFIVVDETILNQQMDIYAFTDPEAAKFADWLYFEEPVRSLDVRKDILANAIKGVASISIIDQTFSVPEPGTLLLLGAGLSGLMLAGRRR